MNIHVGPMGSVIIARNFRCAVATSVYNSHGQCLFLGCAVRHSALAPRILFTGEIEGCIKQQ